MQISLIPEEQISNTRSSDTSNEFTLLIATHDCPWPSSWPPFRGGPQGSIPSYTPLCTALLPGVEGLHQAAAATETRGRNCRAGGGCSCGAKRYAFRRVLVHKYTLIGGIRQFFVDYTG